MSLLFSLYVRLYLHVGCCIITPIYHTNEISTHLINSQEVAELRRQIAIEHMAKQKKEKVLDADVPTEFECCYCTTKVCTIESFGAFYLFYFNFIYERFKLNRSTIVKVQLFFYGWRLISLTRLILSIILNIYVNYWCCCIFSPYLIYVCSNVSS